MHVDSDFAKKAGFPDVFAQGMLAMAYLGQAVTDAAPPDRLRSFSTRFLAITQTRRQTHVSGVRRGTLRGERRETRPALADRKG